MRLFPDPWEGAHSLFPERTRDPSAPGPPLLSTLAGLGTYGIARLFGRAKTPGTAMLMVGYNSLLFYIADSPFIVSRFTYSGLAARAVFEKDKVPMPAWSLVKSTPNITLHDLGIVGAVAGLARAATTNHFQTSVPRRLFMSLGSATTGFTIGVVLLGQLLIRPTPDAVRKYENDLVAQGKASRAFRSYMGRDPPAELYPLAASVSRYKGFTVAGQDGFEGWKQVVNLWGKTDETDETDPVVSSVDEYADLINPDRIALGLEKERYETMPPGSHAFTQIKVDDRLEPTPLRDYEWQPESIETGIQILHRTIHEEAERRAMLVQSAEYTWRELVKWEKRLNLILLKEPDSDEKSKQVQWLRRSTELLSSMHFERYQDINRIDWIIADARKQILQLESRGEWMPAGTPTSYNPDSYDCREVRDAIAKHRDQLQAYSDLISKNLEMLLNAAPGQVVGMSHPEFHESTVRRAEEEMDELKLNMEATDKVYNELTK